MFRTSVPQEFKRIVTRKAVELGGSIQGVRDERSGQVSFTVSLGAKELTEFKEWYENHDFNHEDYKFCSFCGAEESEVEKMIMGSKKHLFICNGCVVLCNSIVRE